MVQVRGDSWVERAAVRIKQSDVLDATNLSP